MKFVFWSLCVGILSVQWLISSVMAVELLPQRHLIVAPERFHEGLQSYVAHKQNQLPTQMVSLESILKDSAGIDDAEKLKRYLYAQWKNEHIGYVLLVGDADVMPVRYMVLDRVTKPAFDYAFYPSDLYYSDLAKRDGSLDDWNSQKDAFHANYFGEVRGEANKNDAINFDDIDYRPEVAVGRWPVSTIAEVALVADKVIAYETSILGGNKPGARNAALFSVGGWVDSRDVMDEVGNGLGPRWSIDKRYYSSRGRESKSLPTSKALVQLLNEGVGLAIHAGHGQDDQWEQCFPSS